MKSIFGISLTLLLSISMCHGYDQLDSFTDSIFRAVMNRIGAENSFSVPDIEDYSMPSDRDNKEPVGNRVIKDYETRAFEPRDDGLLGREPSIRDQEYLEHSSLFGHQYMQGGAGEGFQRLKPDGSMKNVQVIKTDGVLPAYCNPPDPCPLGYTAEDGCLDNFVNSAAFSREYQAAQECMCDSEHMFDCPGATRENEIDALARSFENEGIVDTTLDRLIHSMEIEGDHKNLVAKKFFSYKPANPFLEGDKLPVVAKKTPKPLSE